MAEGNTANPTGVTFLKSQSSNLDSKLERLFSLKHSKRDIRALSFEIAFENVTTSGIGSIINRESTRSWPIRLLFLHTWEGPPYTSRPTQSIKYIPFQVNRFQKSILLVVQYKYLK